MKQILGNTERSQVNLQKGITVKDHIDESRVIDLRDEFSKYV